MISKTRIPLCSAQPAQLCTVAQYVCFCIYCLPPHPAPPHLSCSTLGLPSLSPFPTLFPADMCLNPQMNPKLTLNPHLRATSAWAGTHQPSILSHVTKHRGQSPCLGYRESSSLGHGNTPSPLPPPSHRAKIQTCPEIHFPRSYE